MFYDYAKPLSLPEKLAKHSFDMVVADPPFLSEECLRKTLETVSFLARGKIILCTGKHAIFLAMLYYVFVCTCISWVTKSECT